MNKLCVAIALLSIFGPCAHAEQSVAPDARTAVRVSNRDINRFVCPGAMQDMIYSKEKDISGHFSKHDAFIKFKIKKIGTSREYATEDNELFLVCDGNVYNIIAQPVDIPSTTVRLTPPVGNAFKKNVAMFKNMPLEKQALRIIRQAYRDQYPSSYKITAAAARQVVIRADLEVRLKQYVDVEGVGLRLKRYDIRSVASATITVAETDFLHSRISPSLLAIAVEDHTLGPNETTRLFVVEKKEDV
ncbi:type-F conjugative transfer system secretin TraK [Desulfogranum marinum]|uniref:type-F conjugative transfer system secretin TraK n=1 Tax=Desulfogranum marinum TaxID=453220 RepID=UPI0019664563|nr:type-F conjugative transfer system secretin TraK [Desulfogranum marinum]MBM9514063.1 type-F conjugative transfer system secretin TraK [Desulfogranum marinum]